MMLRHLCIAIAALSVLSGAAFAQGISNQFIRAGLTQEDIDIMAREAATLFHNRRATVGSDTVWQNPATGAHGLAEITEVKDNCVRIAYRFKTRKLTQMQTVLVRECKVDGKWILSG